MFVGPRQHLGAGSIGRVGGDCGHPCSRSGEALAFFIMVNGL
jgi:hypothetical protein